ncbi:methyltransferase domain-containing protein [Opitutus terrae]|uniref:Methyltransferase type 11 n=1 Tax=Opitutus terrae (strain DSM 11246 / JCM 15787 / PB90-1) TaxID=452637 RepID=B1ZZN5_OPITP|nr:methyltransferase domain-containing protein [Opitutus terrae]ACB77221.1 Methyltransferase type 11 [Opitutus terrae PB90-1]
MPLLEEYPNAPDFFFAYRHWLSFPSVQRKPGGWEFEGHFYPDYLFVGGASFAIERVARRYCTGTGLDIGAGLWPLPGATAVDLERGPGHGRTLDEFADSSQDYVFSSHCLEHITDWRTALASWIRKLKRGGRLFLYLPHPECAIWRPGSPFVGDGHKWQPTPEILKSALAELQGNLIAHDDGPDAMRSFFVCAEFGLTPRFPVV